MNQDFRKRLLVPALIPLGAFAFIGVLVFAFSRFLLVTTTEGSVVVAIVMAGAILFAAGALAKGGAMKDVQRLALVAFGLLVIGGGVTAGAVMHTRPVEAHLETVATITAQNTAFDAKDLAFPADEPFAFAFANRDAGVPHNVAIYRDQAAGSKQDEAGTLFKGEVFPGPATRTYEVAEGLPAGVYFFQCDIHPFMNGTARAGGAGPAPTASPTPTGTGSPSPTASATPSPTATATGGATVSIAAKNLAFDKNAFDLVANAPAVVAFDNQDASVPHNVSIYTDSSATQSVFRGEIFPGAAERRYTFTAPAAGTYFFRCDVHFNMNGTVTVR